MSVYITPVAALLWGRLVLGERWASACGSARPASSAASGSPAARPHRRSRRRPAEGADVPRVLVVAYFFPPLGGGGVHRPLAWARYLPEHGWDVTVLASAPRRLLRR